MYKSHFGIIFVHGIVGNCRIFNFLSPLPLDSHAVYLTLQGHGGDALAFSKASMDAWRQQVEDAVDDMRLQCDKVIIVAHSMGCLFAISQAARRRIDGLLLLNPPLKIRVAPKAFTNIFKVLFSPSDSEEAAAAKDAYGIAVDFNPVHYYGWVARYIELFSEIRKTRNVLMNTQLECPVEIFLSANDELVSTSSSSVISGQPHCRLTILDNSSHYRYTSSACDMIKKRFAALLQ